MNARAYDLVLQLRAILHSLPGATSIALHASEVWTLTLITTLSDGAIDDHPAPRSRPRAPDRVPRRSGPGAQPPVTIPRLGAARWRVRRRGAAAAR
jgi:hypothetical protein